MLFYGVGKHWVTDCYICMVLNVDIALHGIVMVEFEVLSIQVIMKIEI